MPGAPPSPDVAPGPQANTPEPIRVRAIVSGGIGLVRHNRRATMLPLAVTMLPAVLAAAVAQFLLLSVVYGDAPYESLSAILEDSPRGLQFNMVAVTWILSLFTLVGFAATVVSVNALLRGKPLPLSGALDPAFTRMGGLLGIGGVAFLLWTLASVLAVTVVGTAFMLYAMVRTGLAVHAFILDGESVRSSLRTSWNILRGNTLRLFGLALWTMPFAVAAFACAIIVGVLVTIPFAPSNPGRDGTLVVGAVGVVVVGLAFLPVLAFIATTTTMFYSQLKARADVRTAPGN